MMRIRTAAILLFFAGSFALPAAGAQAETKAETAPSGIRTAQASQPMATEVSAQRRRPLRRLPIYPRYEWEPDVWPRYNPGPNAVPDCTAPSVQQLPLGAPPTMPEI